MDPRHESLKEGFLNHVIMTINSYILDNIDTLVKDKTLHDELLHICKRIYHYLDVDVDSENILSNHNLLSKDVVVFPNIPDPEANKILDDADFEKLILEIKKLVEQKSSDGIINKHIMRVIEEYEL